MCNINSEIIDRLRDDIQQLRYKYRNNLLEWNHVNHILINEVLPLIYRGVKNELDMLERENKRLKTEINRLSFRNDPERDKKILQLFRCCYSNGRIAKQVGMSKWGVSKALRRLGVN